MSNTTVRCLLIPIGEGQILLPSVVIAEVSPDMEISPLSDNQPSWLLGIINWRGQNVPLVSLENALSLPIVTSKKSRTVILYGLEYGQTVPFYAFNTTDVPRTFLVNEDSLTKPSTDVGPGLVFNVHIENSETTWIPDLSYLENLVHQTISTLK